MVSKKIQKSAPALLCRKMGKETIMDVKKCKEIKIFANEIRIEILKMLAEAGSGHAGGALDLADLVAVLYSGAMKIDPKDPGWADRDYLVMSKGHAGPVLYAALALKGYFPMEELATLNKPGTHLPSHCDRLKTPGIDMTAGSLGQGIGVAAGIALGNQLAGRDNYTFCIVGDGEMDEGSVWEALIQAPQHKLNRFIVIVDNNGLQIDGPTREVADLGDISQKAAAFGWCVTDVDGHDVEQIEAAIESCKQAGRPAFINLHTIKAKGWGQYESQVGSHYINSITKEAVAEPIEKLEAEIRALKA